MPFKKQSAKPIIDSRHLKVLAAKREDLKDSVVFICLDEEKYGHIDQGKLRAVIEQIDKLEPDGVYFPMLENMGIEFYERSQFRNRDLIITIRHPNPDEADLDRLEDTIRQAIPNARSISFIHEDVEFGGLK